MDNNNNTVRPAQFQVFKKKTAVRFQLARADQHYKVGCIFMQIAPGKNGNGTENGYDWENSKISVKLGSNDISSIKHGIGRGVEISLFHTFGKESKRITFTPNAERGGYFIAVQAGDVKQSIPVSSEEVDTLLTLLSFSIPIIHNWI